MHHPLANVIEPLVFAVGAQLLVGNFLVATVEMFAVRRRLGVGRLRLWCFALAGNYASALLGIFILGVLVTALAPWVLGSEPLQRTGRLAVLIAVLAFLLSVLIEWPFFHLAMPMERRRARSSLLSCSIAQVASYLLLLPLYAYVSTDTLRNWTIVPANALATGEMTSVLFLSPSGGVQCIGLDGNPARAVPGFETIASAGGRNSLEWVADPEQHGLQLRLGGPDRDSRMIARTSAAPQTIERYTTRTPRDVDDPLDLRALKKESPRGWTVYTSPYAHGGLTGFPPDDTMFYRSQRLVALDLLFFSWGAQYATMLPGDRVVFQFGDQIVLADIPTRRLAVLARGHGPAVAYGFDSTTLIPISQ